MENDGLPSKICNKCIIQVSKAYTFKNQCLKSESMLREKLHVIEKKSPVFQLTENFEEELVDDDSFRNIKLIFVDNQNLSQIVEEEDEGDCYESQSINQNEYVNIIEEQTVLDSEYRYNIKSDDGNTIQISIHDHNDAESTSNYEIIEKPTNEIESKPESEEYEEYDELKTDDESQYYDHEKNDSVKLEEEELHDELNSEQANDQQLIEQPDETHLIEEQNDSNDVDTGTTVLKLYLPDASTSTNSKGKFACPICSRILSNRNSLNYHMQLHSDKASFVCNVCGEKFKTRNSYTGHMTTHEPENQHKCEICQKVYRQAASLKNHMLSHTGQKPFGIIFYINIIMILYFEFN